MQMQPNGLMFTEDASITGGGSGPVARFNGTAVRFHSKPVRNEQKSAEAGRPVYDPVDYIEIRVPGDKSNIVDRPVSEKDKQQYAQAYAAWKAGNKEQVNGTPLSLWPPAGPEVVLELEHFGCRTVEQLGEMSDANLGNVGPFRALREQAKAWLEAARGHAPVARLVAEKEAMGQEIAALKAQVASLEAALAKQGKGK